MLEILKIKLWENIFERIEGLTREEVAGHIGVAWDKVDCQSQTEKRHALGVFRLKKRENHHGAHFVFVRAVYDREYADAKSMEVDWIFSLIQNQQDALLEFSRQMSRQEKEWLMVHLHLITHPDFRG